ncbi:MAG: TfoX/Sxy family protein [Dehalococcoidia bacterium]|nr:TfoX/Sxy family protein [Dehalococcoidia bacterium]
MPLSAFCQQIVAYLSPLGAVTTRAMFGGHGVYCDGIMFGLVADDTLYLKVDTGIRAGFAAAGSAPFRSTGKGGAPIAMSYWRVPDDFVEDQPMALDWARGSLDTARRAKSGARRARSRPSFAPRWRGVLCG